VLTLVVIPAIYSLWQEWEVSRRERRARSDTVEAELPVGDPEEARVYA